MFKFDNTHIFTGYLKQLLSSVNIPMCKIYTTEYSRYLELRDEEDPRVLASFNDGKRDIRVNYLKANELYNYYQQGGWERISNLFYDKEKFSPGLTKTLVSHGNSYDTTTHEYLGDYLRFLRDYYDINLMSLYNCFNNKIYNNISHEVTVPNPSFDTSQPKSTTNAEEVVISQFNSQDAKYNIYAVPVRLFADYTIAIDCHHGIELFCGLYKTRLDESSKGKSIIRKTYKKINKTLFNQPFLFDKLNIDNWMDAATKEKDALCWDIVNREQDLRLFIKVPVTCKSSIVVLEGDYRNFNNCKYTPVNTNDSDNAEKTTSQEVKVYKRNGNIIYIESAKDSCAWDYRQNKVVLNFSKLADEFKPISKLQLLAFNTGESYPFANRLVEYLSASAITPIDEMPDNIKRVQKVMNKNHHYFKIEGLWEDKMQRILYDSLMNAGPMEVKDGMLIDKRQGYQPKLGQTSKSTLFDVLGYGDRDAEKWYASWENVDGNVKMVDNIHSVDIYDGLYNI